MSSAPPSQAGVLDDSDEQIRRWQQVEAEAWGILDAPEEPTIEPSEPEPAEDRRPVVLIACLVLVALVGLWIYTRPTDADLASGKAVVAPAVAREIPDACTVLGELRKAQGAAFAAMLGEDDPAGRLRIVRQRATDEIRVLDRLLVAESELTFAVASMRFRAQQVLDGAAAVDAGQQTPDEMLAASAAIDDQAAGGEQAIATYEAEHCAAG